MVKKKSSNRKKSSDIKSNIKSLRHALKDYMKHALFIVRGNQKANKSIRTHTKSIHNDLNKLESFYHKARRVK
ncbi:hypothetical protein J4405_00105 [Candidatus Woesearchaeota archaeon]|nr:hypothetical protein [Candidatus Woesearchaeota archaeon]